MMIRLKPSVITLDVEMPGMSGIDFLEEIMRERPTPVVMLSTLTQKGAETSFRALELGAIDCFPKPQSATQDEFNALAPKLAALVKAASNGGVKKTKAVHRAPQAAFDWNGNMIAMSASVGGVDALLNMLPTFPANCPPTIILLQTEQGFVEPLLQRLRASCAAKIVMAEDGQALAQGTIQLVTDPTTHAVIDHWPNASLRLMRADPVGGIRPSASLLFATLAKTAGASAIGVILTGMGTDGAAGLKALRATGARTITQNSATAVVDEAPAAARALGAAGLDLPLAEISAAVLSGCTRAAAAA